jgi:CDP-paratose 2-epimerase
VTTSIADPQLDFRSNIMGGFNLLEAVRQFNPQAILLYSSTNKVYGNLSSHTMKENQILKRYEDPSHPQGYDEQEKIDFISPYGCSKGSTDLYFQDYARIFGLSTVVFRQSCIYGPFQIGVEDQGWVAHFAKQYLFKKPITIFGNGMQVRDLLYVEDLIQAYDLAIKNIAKVKGMAFNIGGGVSNSFSILQTINILEQITHNQVKVSFSEERLGDQKIYISANRKIRDLLGWEPKMSFKDGIIHLLDWQRQFYNT